MFPTPIRTGLGVAAAAAMLLTAGCEDKSPLFDDVDEIDRIELNVGSQVIEIEDNVVTGGPILVDVNGTVSIAASFFDDDDELDEIDTDAFRLEVVPDNGSVTFTRTGPFSGTLTGVTADDTTVSVCLFDIAENECRIGPFDVAISID